jgi:hypothetical protein
MTSCFFKASSSPIRKTAADQNYEMEADLPKNYNSHLSYEGSISQNLLNGKII